MKKRSKSQKKRTNSNSQPKYLMRTIMLQTPYLADGFIKKKYLNPGYLKEIQVNMENKRTAQRGAEEPYQPGVLKPIPSPYATSASTSQKRKLYPNVKSKYMEDTTSMISFSKPNNYVVRILLSKFDVGIGNNSQMIVRLMNKRPWWRSSSDSYRPINFHWKMSLRDFNFSLLCSGPKENVKCLNRFERFWQIGNKDNLFRNLYFQAQVDL